ncbi:type I 3-dehydroquinate dehydratase [Methanobacterium alcaliphilum]|uniref:type I 3-dehydroquinate dehydratase n=1 Tax=Methanobacterium alcaliphilum TaxID=392018 RepID=UPI003CCC24E9
MSDNPKICVPIFEKSIENALKVSKSCIKKGADILELRIDAIQNPTPENIKKLVGEINFPLIVTNRTLKEGGFFKGTEEERINILISASSKAEYVDIELQTDEENLSRILELNTKTIVSFHDFEKTPPQSELLNIVKHEKEIGDIAKFAVMPLKIEDTLSVLNILSQEDNTVGISMGEIGKYTRLVAPLFGSPFTFASAGSKTAPGQLDLESTRFILDKLLENKSI